MCTECAGGAITPDMTVEELRTHHPKAEFELRTLVPSYGAITSEAVRAVLARSTTLHQLSMRGGVALGPLLTALRQAAGIDDRAAAAAAAPDWVRPDRVVARLDARPILAAGDHPLQQVMDGVGGIDDGLYELVTPFVPGPLIDLVRSRGFDAFSRWDGDIVRTYFRHRR